MQRPRLLTVRQRLLRAAAITTGIATVAAAFAWAAGWLGTERLTTARLIGRMEENAGVHPGYRRAHPRGICFKGHIEGNGALASSSRAGLLAAGRIEVLGRFSVGAGNPHAADTSVSVRSMALLLRQADGQQWRMAMNNPPVLAVRTPEDFYQQLGAMRPDPVTGKPDSRRVQAFFDAHPESAEFRSWVSSYRPSDSFASTRFNSINAFVLVDSVGGRQAVRWSMVPELAATPLAQQEAADDALQRDLLERVAAGPLRWQWRFTLAGATDAVDDPTRSWSVRREQVDAGTLVVEQARTQLEGDCYGFNFDPLVLPDGVEPSGDAILRARSAAYAESYRRRTAEGLPSDIDRGAQP
ncbi:catalase family peroxidase [Pseudomonas sp. QE6]|uniref:catalase family peroxidase n=1 Tax=Pseudomonas sp. QE6 TaxID=3242491 RepID=UPI0035295D76